MFPSMNIQVALPYSNDDDDNDVRIRSKRLEGNADAIQDAHPVVITENDVLLGRGGKKSQHAGNEKLRLMATKYSCLYKAALKREKPAIALFLVHLVQSMKPSGRFLKQTGVRGWEIVSEEVAREKVSQCLRDIVKVSTPKIGDESEEPRALTSEALLSGIELDEANSFVRASTAALTDLPKDLDGESNSNYFLNNFVSESCFNSKPADEEYAFVNQAISRAEQLKNDDSAFHRLIDRMLLEEK